MRNKYAGNCYRCGAVVNPGDGHFERHLGGWRTQHASCCIKWRNKHTPMKLKIENFMQIKSADIDIADTVTLIGGDNGAGKTSALLPLAALLTGETLPFAELKKKDSKILVNDKSDAKSSTVTLTWASGGASIKWPSCKLETTSEKISSPYAAGLREPAKIPPRELTELLGVLPTKDQFRSELEDIALGVDDIHETIESVWTKIQTSGWDAAHEHAVTRRQSLKQEWAKVAGIPWAGDTAAGTWRPEHYVGSNDGGTGKSLEQLELALNSEQKIFEFALKAEALDEREREQLQALANSGPTVEAELSSATEELNKNTTEIAKARELLAQLPKILNSEQIYHCWKCQAPNALRGQQLIEPPEQISEEEISAARARYASQESIIDTLKDNRSKIEYRIHELGRRLEKSRDAQKKLKVEGVIETKCSVSVDEARAAVELVRKQIAAHKIKTECDQIFDSVTMSNYLCNVLCPDGLRKIVLGTKLAEFNEILSIICETAEWPLIAIDELLNFSFDGYPFVLLSKGQKFAVNCALQVAFAKLDGSQVLIFDGVDVLGKELKNGLFNLLLNIPLRSVVGCRFDKPSEVPDLSELKGLSYWCENGSVKSLVAVGR